MPTPTTAAPQIRRVVRYFRRLKAIYNGISHDRPSEELEDDAYSFFLHCHQLKDWVKHDPPLARLGDVEDFINRSPELRICADLCNTSKHFKLTRKLRSTVNPTPGAKTFGLEITLDKPEPPVIRVQYEIETTAGKRDALEIATKCISAWAGFLGIDAAAFEFVDSAGL